MARETLYPMPRETNGVCHDLLDSFPPFKGIPSKRRAFLSLLQFFVRCTCDRFFFRRFSVLEDNGECKRGNIEIYILYFRVGFIWNISRNSRLFVITWYDRHYELRSEGIVVTQWYSKLIKFRSKCNRIDRIDGITVRATNKHTHTQLRQRERER